ncbi:phosphodiester glycosidase family protein [Paenibacillus sp. FJAT-26967]|uniref:phosphodiester glycosidase family protein n=1 Tax=Paenibacillus sp. FJAT-26967 TaxID=1729690 RepID=UPI0008384234|nr:phosphodiester glycosidase family protein [Paenibacillus sp. FJAT-26967]
MNSILDRMMSPMNRLNRGAGTRFRRSAAALLLGTSVLLAASSLPQAAAAGSVESGKSQVKANGKNFSVSWVKVDVTDPRLEVMPVTAARGIGYDESFSSMIAKSGAVAAVNGTFFNAYEKDASIRYPNGLLLHDGNLLHSGENQSIIVDGNKEVDIRKVNMSFSVTVTHGGKPYTFSPWGTNKDYGSGQTDQVVWFTPEFKSAIDMNGTKVVVRNGLITEITPNAVYVPYDGFVCLIGNSSNNRNNLLPNLHVGDSVKADLEVTENGQDIQGADTWQAAIGAGPKLLTNGKVDINPSRDGYSDPKITKQAAMRSFVGSDAAGKLVMGTVNGATMQDLAEIALSLGMTDAMNLDGGASSGLYANGSMLTTPGRALSNALVVKKYYNPQVQVAVDGKLAGGFKGFVSGDTTMVPMRPLLDAMNANYKWDNTAHSLTLKQGDVEMVMTVGNYYIRVNGTDYWVPNPPALIDNYLYVPLRFTAEHIGAEVKWDQRLYRADIILP